MPTGYHAISIPSLPHTFNRILIRPKNIRKETKGCRLTIKCEEITVHEYVQMYKILPDGTKRFKFLENIDGKCYVNYL